jgi:hypothetical protein
MKRRERVCEILSEFLVLGLSLSLSSGDGRGADLA